MQTTLPSERYRAALSAHDYDPDPAQERAIKSLDRIWLELQTRNRSGLPATIRKLLKIGPGKTVPVPGLYMWGGVGRGKTLLMDQFFQALPFENKQRLHFHRFMQQVHTGLKQLKDTEDPLNVIARELAKKTRVICFDEFFVSDVADAMILGRLFEYLFQYGITLVATSNISPDDLYKEGLQRSRFLPAIQLIKKHCEILSVDAGNDYRLRKLEAAEIYHYPLDQNADKALKAYFQDLSGSMDVTDQVLQINDREISVRGLAEGIVWLDFSSLCEGPRSSADYIEISREFHTVLLSNIPVLDWESENEARRLVSLVDELYDHQVNLIVSAEAEVESIYQGQRLTFEFRRTVSRLQEMRSHEYLARKHLP